MKANTIFPKTRDSPPEMFLGKGVLKICSKFTGEHPCQSVISIKLCSRGSTVNLLHIFRTSFYKNTYRGLLLKNCAGVKFSLFINLKLSNSWKDISKHLIISEMSISSAGTFCDGNANNVKYFSSTDTYISYVS